MEGYIAPTHNEGPPGPLNTRPLMVLSMPCRLLVSVRLVDAIQWQEGWAHRSTRAALDKAAVTNVHPALCRLWRWAVAAMSIHCVKCFDLIP